MARRGKSRRGKRVATPAVAALAGLPAGSELLSAIAGLDLSSLTGFDLPLVLRAAYRLGNHARALLLDVVAETMRRKDPDGIGTGGWDAVAVHEVRAALTMSRTAANSLNHLAQDLSERLPQVLDAMRAGLLDQPRARVFSSWTAWLSETHARAVVDALLPVAPMLTTGELIDEIRRVAIELDPDFARRQHDHGRSQRRVRGAIGHDGTGHITAEGLSAEQIAASCDRLDAIGWYLKRAGHPDKLDHIRTDVFAGLLTGEFAGLTDEQLLEKLLANMPATPQPAADSGPSASGPQAPCAGQARDRAGQGDEPNSADRCDKVEPGTDRDQYGDATTDGQGDNDPPGEAEPADGLAAVDGRGGGVSGSAGDGVCREQGSATDDVGESAGAAARELEDAPVTDSRSDGPGVDDQSTEDGIGEQGTDQGLHPDEPPGDERPEEEPPEDEPGGGPRLGPTSGGPAGPRGAFPASAGQDSTMSRGGPGVLGESPRGEAPPGPDPPDITGGDHGGGGVRLHRRGLRLWVGLGTIAGLDRRPGELLGWGLLHAELARQVAAAPAATWWYAITDKRGRPLHVGPLRRPTKPWCDGQPVDVHGVEVWLQLTAAELAGLIAHPPPGWERLVDDIRHRITHSPAGAPNGDPTDRFPNASLRRYLSMRDRRCMFPTCRIPSHRCQADHTIDHAQGGPTVDTNVSMLCAGDHALKTNHGWHARQKAPGHLIWTSPLGHVYERRPPRGPARARPRMAEPSRPEDDWFRPPTDEEYEDAFGLPPTRTNPDGFVDKWRTGKEWTDRCLSYDARPGPNAPPRPEPTSKKAPTSPKPSPEDDVIPF